MYPGKNSQIQGYRINPRFLPTEVWGKANSVVDFGSGRNGENVADLKSVLG